MRDGDERTPARGGLSRDFELGEEAGPEDDAPLRARDIDTGVLLRLVAREMRGDPGHPMWRHEGYLQWLADEARAGDARRRRRETDEDALARGRALMALAYARKAGVGVLHGWPPLRPADVEGSASRVLAAARARHATPAVELGAAAGVGREIWDEPVEQWLELTDEVRRALRRPLRGECLALRVVGDSMAPLMHTGDTVLVQLGPTCGRDTVIIARHPEDGYLCKRVQRVLPDVIELASIDPGRPPVTIPRDPALILGTVLLVWCTHHRD